MQNFTTRNFWSRVLASMVIMVLTFSSFISSYEFAQAVIPTPVIEISGWKDGQTKLIVEFGQSVYGGMVDNAPTPLVAADFVVGGANQIAITSVSHFPGKPSATLTLAGNLNSSNADFTISCAADSILNFENTACAVNAISVYEGAAEDSTGPTIAEVARMMDTGVFVMLNEEIDPSTAIAGNFTLVTSNTGDNSAVTAVNVFDFGMEVLAAGAVVGTGAGNTITMGTGVLDVFGNAALEQTVKILPTLKISEVQVASATNTKQEFIEIYNFGNSPVDVSTLKLHIYDQTGPTDTDVPLTFFQSVIPANGFFLIATNSFQSGSNAVPNATYSGTTVQLVDNGAAYISLSSTANTDVIDMVGWGSSAKYEGQALANLATGKSYERKADFNATSESMAAGGGFVSKGNGFDTQNNFTDLVLQNVPVPQDSFFQTEFPWGAGFEEGGDTTPPTVMGSFPNDASANFIPTFLEQAGADFSEIMDASTISTATVKLYANSAPGTNLCASVSYDPGSTFSPDVTCLLSTGALPLAAAGHTFKIVSGGSGAKDIAGNQLAADYTVTFTPSAGVSFQSSSSPFVVGSRPGHGTRSFPPNGTKIVVNFSQSLDATTLSGNVTVTDRTANVVKTINGLGLIASEKSDDTLVIDMTGATFTAGNEMRVSISNLVESSDGAAIEPFVLDFFVADTNDVTGPVVMNTRPFHTATAVPVGTPDIIVHLDDILDPSTVNTNTVNMYLGSDEVPISVFYEGRYNDIIIQPSGVLEASSLYRVSLSAGAADPAITNISNVDLQDTDGSANDLHSFTFTTGTADVTAPQVQFATATQNTISVTFTEPVREQTITNLANWTLQSPVGTSVPLSSMAGSMVNWNPGSMTAELKGVALTAGNTFQVVLSTAVADMSGNPLAVAATLGGNVLDSGVYGEALGPGDGFKGETWDMPTGFSTDSFGFVPQPGVFPMNAMAGATSVYNVNFPITEQIRASGNSGKVILTFPTGFDVTNAIKLNDSPMNKDVNGPGPGTVGITGVTANATARTVTVTFTAATRCATGNTDPCVSGDEHDFIGFDLGGIVNSATPRSWETSGYTVDLKTMTGTTLLETMTSMPFFINEAGTDSLEVTLTAAGATSGTAVIHLMSPSIGDQTQTANFATNADGTAVVTFDNISEGMYDLWTKPMLELETPDDFMGITHNPIWVTGDTTKAITLEATAGMETLTVNLSGATGKDVDIVAGCMSGDGDGGCDGKFFMKQVENTAGNDSVTMKVAVGKYFVGIMPHMPMDGGFVKPEAPDYVVTPGSINITVTADTITETSGTANDGTVAFALSAADHTAVVNVVDINNNPIMDANVYMDFVDGGFATFGSTGADGKATLNVNAGRYRVGVFMHGAPPPPETKVLIEPDGDIFVDGSATESAEVTIKLGKGAFVISGNVTDGVNSVANAGVHAWCTANCEGYQDAFSMTSVSGTYTLYIGNGTWNVEAFIPGYGPTPVTTVTVSGADQTNINLAPSANSTFYTISGTVCSKEVVNSSCVGGTGLQGIDISAWGSNGSNFTKTSTDGTYSLRVPASGGTTYTIEAWDPRKGPLPKLTSITVNGDVTSKDIVIGTPRATRINVEDGAGDPVTVVEMFVDFVSQSGNTFQHAKIKDASFGTLSLPNGTYNVNVFLPGAPLNPVTAVQSDDAGTSVTAGVLVVDGAETIKIVLPALHTVSGDVTGGGIAVENAWVEFSDASNGVFKGAATNASGDYSITLQAGTYQVSVFAPGSVSQATTLVVDGTETLDLTVTTALYSISGTVRDPSANAVPYAFVEARRDGGGFVGTSANAEGAYVLPVNDGVWTVSAIGHGFAYETLAAKVVITNASATGKNITFDTTVEGLLPPKIKPMVPAEGGIVQDTELKLNVTIPANATSTSSSTGSVTTKETNNVTDTTTSDVIGNGFEVKMTDSAGTQLTSNFTEDVSIDKTMTKAALVAEGMDTFAEVDELTVSYLSASGSWKPEATTITYYDGDGDVVLAPAANLSDVAEVKFSTSVDHFTVFSITDATDGLAPAAPTGLAATAGDASVVLTWTAVTTNSDTSAISDLAGYEVYRDTSSSGSFTTQINNADVTLATFTDSTATNGVTYYYKVTAGDTGGNESVKSTAASATPAAVVSGGGGGGGGSSAATYKVTLTGPAGALKSGEAHNVTWTTSGLVSYVKLRYSKDGGISSTLIAANTVSSPYLWTIPASLSGSVLLMADGYNSNGTLLASSTLSLTITGTPASESDVVVEEDAAQDASDTALGITEDSEGKRLAPASGISGPSPVTGQTEAISVIHPGQFIRGPSFTTVYYVTDDLQRRAFWDTNTYFTWAQSWDDVVWVTDATLSTLPLTHSMLPKAGTVLVKIKSDARVYAVQASSANPSQYELRWVTSEAIARESFGANWADYVIDLDPTVFPRYEVGLDWGTATAVNLGLMRTRLQLSELQK